MRILDLRFIRAAAVDTRLLVQHPRVSCLTCHPQGKTTPTTNDGRHPAVLPGVRRRMAPFRHRDFVLSSVRNTFHSDSSSSRYAADNARGVVALSSRSPAK
jgi:hypothetical protein